MRHVPPVTDVLPLFLRWSPRGQRSLFREDPLKPERRFTDDNAFALELFGKFAQNVVVLPERQTSRQSQGAKIRTDGGKDMGFFDPTQHHGLVDPVFLERLDELIELTDLNPVDPIDMAGQLRFRLAFMRHSRYVIAEPSGIIREDDGETSVAGNQPNPFAIGDVRQECHSAYSSSS